MTVDTTPSAHGTHKPDISHIQSMLTSNKLLLRDEFEWTRDIICAVQPLSIDGKEIFADTVLAEFIRYRDAVQMNREAGTLTLKKSAFGDFEASMTPIPKYCFRDDENFTTVQVHSVPRFTLDDVLHKSEKDFPSLYTWENYRFYYDWAKLMFERIRHNPPSGGNRRLKTILALPKYIFPPPPHIPRDERKKFAAMILRIVAEHHRAKIYHDRISERTIFFPTACQPLFLSNYSGVPAPLLGDLIPMELLGDEAVKKYGPQCRDLYSMALLCYRIMTGERYDGTQFMLKSPRPLRTALNDIATDAGLAFSFKNFSEIVHTFSAMNKVLKVIASLLPSLFSDTTFTAWRKLNRATGGLWRMIPVVGPFCDIFQPTQCASALRYILDRHWFMQFVSRKNLQGRPSNTRGPEISLLTEVFKEHLPRRYPHYESAVNVLISDSGFKRMAFDSLMDSGHSVEIDRPFILTVKKILTGSAIIVVIASLFCVIAFLRNSKKETEAAHRSAMVDPTGRSQFTDATHASYGSASPPAVELPDPTAAALNKADSLGGTHRYIVDSGTPRTTNPAAAAPDRSRAPNSSTTYVDGKENMVAPTATDVKLLTAETDTERTAKVAVRSKIPTRKPASSPAKNITAPCGAFSPALGFRDVSIVVSVTDSCNPGNLKYQPAGNRDTTAGVKPPVLPPKLFIVRRSYSGFGPIESIMACRTDGCDKTLYYKTIEGNISGKPAFVKTGDAMSPDKNGLQLFIKSRMAMYKK